MNEFCNPQTGAKLKIKALKTVSFKAGADLKAVAGKAFLS